MPASIDLVALSLLPVTRWPVVVEQLRSGVPAHEILATHCAEAASGRRRPPWANLARLLEQATRAWERTDRARVRPVAWSDPEYPALLAMIPDPPPVLWVAGDGARFSRPCVALVGSRAGSPYALRVAEQLAADLAVRGVTVVSGLARGVDSAAHRGAVTADGGTLAVVGCGADIVYPAEHAALAGEIARNGAIVSELLPGTKPRPEFFPRRNRIISGLSRAVVVIEAGERSGSLITARCALEQGRDVLAVPGNVLNGRNRGGHALLRDGARLVESAEDIIDELQLARAVTVGQPVATSQLPADAVLDALIPGEVADLEEIAARSGLPTATLLPRLLALELQGRVAREVGGRFVRFDRTC
jgi:DNA processing protein